jgi:hypothetical protein
MAEGEAFRSSIAASGLPEPQVEFGELINVFRTDSRPRRLGALSIAPVRS